MSSQASSGTPAAPLANDLALDFQHWLFEIPSADLRKYGSPHFDRRTVGEAIARIFHDGSACLDSETLACPRDLLAVCNHAYPEAALVDPVADLEMWQEWRLGIREFPYLGHYAPLGLFHQPGKTSSPSSVGVIGEILAGRFAEALIAPSVLVRVIGRWPDFILYSGTRSVPNRFAFVESKAVGPDSMPRSDVCLGRVPEVLFRELADQSVRQLNADPFVEVWGCFTHLREIAPLRAAVTLIEIAARKEGTAARSDRFVPAPVLSALAERCLGAALAEMEDEARIDLLTLPAWEVGWKVLESARRHLSAIVRTELGDAAQIAERDMTVALEEALSRLPRRDADLPGQRTRAARDASRAGSGLVPIGSAGGQRIFIAELPEVNQASLRSDWTADWRSAVEPWDVQHGVPLWRAGGAVFAIGPPELAGTPVSAKRARTATAAVS